MLIKKLLHVPPEKPAETYSQIPEPSPRPAAQWTPREETPREETQASLRSHSESHDPPFAALCSWHTWSLRKPSLVLCLFQHRPDAASVRAEGGWDRPGCFCHTAPTRLGRAGAPPAPAFIFPLESPSLTLFFFFFLSTFKSK